MVKRPRAKTGLVAWLTVTALPVFLIDRRLRFRFFNLGMEQLTGRDSESLLGHQCTETSGQAAGFPLEALRPPSDVWSGDCRRVPMRLNRDGDEVREREIEFFPLPEEDGSVGIVMGVVHDALSRKRGDSQLEGQLRARFLQLRQRVRRKYSLEAFLGTSFVMQHVVQQAEAARQVALPLLLCGDAGTGKEFLARAVHQGQRPLTAFVPIDCGRLSANRVKEVLQRLLRQSGEADLAEEFRPGTLMLKHVEEASNDVRELLLVHAAGATKSQPGLRVMGTTRLSLEAIRTRWQEEAPTFGRFMTSLVIEIPTLRERSEDVPLLAQAFLEEWNREREADQSRDRFTPEVLEEFRRYDWPENVAELESVVKEACQLATSAEITAENLPFRFRTGKQAQAEGPLLTEGFIALEERLREVEVEHIQEALRMTRNNKAKAAKLLGMPRAKLYRRLEVLGLGEY